MQFHKNIQYSGWASAGLLFDDWGGWDLLSESKLIAIERLS